MGHPVPIVAARRAALRIGSDSEIADRLKQELITEYQEVVYDLGELHAWTKDRWRPISRRELMERIRAYDGASRAPTNNRIKINKARIDSIRAILETSLERPEFFLATPTGINCANGFITINRDGRPSLASHAPEHKRRHVLPGHWSPRPFQLPGDSLLARLLDGCFRGDPDACGKADLLAEAAGAAALGISARLPAPKAIVLYGPSAENGKSQILHLFRALLPEDAHIALSPSRMGDERHIVQLAGRLLNATDEMGGRAIFADAFKSAVTGEWMMGRDVYRSALKFRPQALHVLACNRLPVFEGGLDAGVRRRLIVLTFNNRIPPPGPDSPRIEGIGRLVGEREPDLLLGWAVAGAARLIARGGFVDLASSREAIADWILLTDLVGGWLRDPDEVRITDNPRDVTLSGDAYRRFRTWAQQEGLPSVRIPIKGEFTTRVVASGLKGVSVTRRSSGRVFLGMRLVRRGRHDAAEMHPQ